MYMWVQYNTSKAAPNLGQGKTPDESSVISVEFLLEIKPSNKFDWSKLSNEGDLYIFRAWVMSSNQSQHRFRVGSSFNSRLHSVCKGGNVDSYKYVLANLKAIG